MQPGAESQPRKRFGLVEGFRSRSKSESGAGSRGSIGLRLWGSNLARPHQPEAIAESEGEDAEDDVFESPRCDLHRHHLAGTVNWDPLGVQTQLLAGAYVHHAASLALINMPRVTY